MYEKGIRLCGERKVGGSDEYALHSGTRIHNNCGYARLYACAIEGKLESKQLRSLPDFEKAEFDSYYAGFESATSFAYPLANLGLLYALEGDWERSWRAGVAALDRRAHEAVRERARLGEKDSGAWIYSPEKVGAYRISLMESIQSVGLDCPSIERPFDPSWSYIEGISELSYGFLFRSLIGEDTEGQKPERENYLKIGLMIHQRALQRFIEEENENMVDFRDATLQRIRNIMTNLIRSFWHFDNRINEVSDARLDSIHDDLHMRVAEIFESWCGVESNGVSLKRSIDLWALSLEEVLSGSIGLNSSACQDRE